MAQRKLLMPVSVPIFPTSHHLLVIAAPRLHCHFVTSQFYSGLLKMLKSCTMCVFLETVTAITALGWIKSF